MQKAVFKQALQKYFLKEKWKSTGSVGIWGKRIWMNAPYQYPMEKKCYVF